MTDIQRSIPVLIVGAGPAGMATALELSKWGVNATVIDALKTPRTTSRAGGVQARTYELLDRYDISRRIIAGRKGINGFTVFMKGKQVAQMPTHLANSRYRQPAGAPQAVIEGVFREVLAEEGVEILWDHELIGLEQDEAGATASIQTTQGVVTLRADWVVGGDGAHSRTRQFAGLQFEGESYPEAYGLMDAQLDWDFPPDSLRMFRDEGPQQIVIVPFDDKFYRIQINNRPVEMERSPPTVEEMQQIYDRLVPIPGVIRDPSWSSAYRLHRKQVTAYRSGQVFVVGDAAHIHSPAGAQGLNTGVQDGINLGWKLGLVVNGAAAPALLDTYEAERRPIAAAVLKLSDTLAREPTSFLANADIPPQVVADTAAQLLVNYRPGPLGRTVAGPPGGPLPPGAPPGAGDRLPDVEIDGASLYRGLQASRVVVVLFGGEDEAGAAAERLARFARSVDVWRRHEGDPLAQALGLRTGAAVIRPDAYLGLVAADELPAAVLRVEDWLTTRLGLVPSCD